MPRVLAISKHFPPMGSAGGSIRVVKFVKYMARIGWDFQIITQDPQRPVVVESQASGFLLNELPGSATIFRVSSPISIPERIEDKSILRNIASISWAMLSIWRGYQVIRKNKIDLIYAVTPVFANALIAVVLSKLCGVRFVLDLKDDYVGGGLYNQKNRFRKAVEKWFEKFVIKASSKVTVVTQESLKLYQERYGVDKGKFYFIPNGCDLDELTDPTYISEKKADHFLILSAASRYQKIYRDAEPFINSLGLFIQQYPEAIGRMRVVFLGNSLSNEYQDLIKSWKIDKIVENHPAVNREDYKKWLSSADLFLLVQPRGNKTAIAGTLYEYWAVGGAPILLFSEEGASQDLIDHFQLGETLHFDETERGAAYIAAIYRSFISSRPVKISNRGVNLFDRNQLAFQMAEIWKDCLEN